MIATFQIVDVVWLILVLGFLTAFCIHKLHFKLPGKLENVFQDLIRYGKTKEQINRSSIFPYLEIPKRWFWHFYVVSVIWNGFLLLLSLRVFFLHQLLPKVLTDLLAFLTGRTRADWTELQPTVLVMQVLLWIHSFRRLLECLYVSVFSSTVIHVVQYAFGLSYYILLGLTVLCVNVSQPTDDLSWDTAGPVLSLFIWLIAGVLLFILASVLQHQSLSLLASLRTSKSGKVETLAHRLPRGGWFEFVSCPHYLAEVLIYTSLSICCGCCSLTWWLVVFYVLCNQSLAAQLCHDYYKTTFKAYPTQRKAFIPFLL